MANTKIPSELVAINAISGTLIADNAITSVHIAENNITAVQIAINAVTALQMADGTITSAKIADGTIVTADIADGQITTGKLADSSVTTGKIAAGTIASADIANNAILTQHIDDNQITADQIADNAVGVDQLAGITRGSVLTGNAAGNPSLLALGAANTLLQSDGTDLVFAPLQSGIDDNSNAVAITIDSSENVGIGTGSPTALLHVKKDVDSFIMKVENDGNSAGTSGASYADASDGLWVDTRWNTATNTPFKVTSNSGTIPMMIIKGNGNVGIGTATPSSPLTISNLDNGTSFSSNRVLQLIGTSTTDGSRVSLAFSGNTNIGNGLAIIEAVNDDQSAGHTSLHMHTYNGSWNTENLVLKGGKVGIGTDNPSDELTIRGAQFATTQISIGDSGDRLRLGYVHSDALVSGTTAGQIVTTAGTELKIAAASNAASNIQFFTSASSGAPVRRMTIDSSGNVGIGVTSIPSWANLMTSGTVAVGGTLYMKTGNTIQALSDFPGGASDLTMQTGGGKVTIGGSGGGNRGHLELFGRYGSGDPKLSFKSDHPTSGNTTTWDMARISASDGGNYNGVLSFQVAAGSGSEGSGAALATAMTIQDTKNVGIGTTNPLQKLVVSDDGGYGFEFAPNNSSVNQILSYDRSADAYRDFKISANQIIFGYGQAGANEAFKIRTDGGLEFMGNSTFIATGNGSTAYEWGSFRRPASAGDGGQLTVRQFSSGDTAANYPAYASSNGSGTWDENTGVYFPELDQVGLTANGNPTLTIEDGRKIELYENGFTSGDANRGQRVCLGGISHIANTNPGGTGSGTYLHVKTNLPKSNIMFRFEYKGLSYSGFNMDTSIIGYTYTGTSYVHSVAIETAGSTTYNFKTPYYSSDNKLVLVLQIANNYTGGVLWAQFVGSHTMPVGTIAIASCIYSGNTSGAF